MNFHTLTLMLTHSQHGVSTHEDEIEMSAPNNNNNNNKKLN